MKQQKNEDNKTKKKQTRTIPRLTLNLKEKIKKKMSIC